MQKKYGRPATLPFVEEVHVMSARSDEELTLEWIAFEYRRWKLQGFRESMRLDNPLPIPSNAHGRAARPGN